MEKDTCIFCRIASGEIPSVSIYEDDRFRIILDIGPASRGHALIIPREHYADLWSLPEDLAAESMKLARKFSMVMVKALQCGGMNLIQNNGSVAGQTIFHFHMHLIPRYKGGEKAITWHAGEIAAEELEAIKISILQQIQG